jgi:hypothetical protein
MHEPPSNDMPSARPRSMAWGRAACVCAVVALSAVDVPSRCRGAAPPLETPYPDWDRGAGDGPTCTVVQDGRSGDHVPLFGWSGDHVPVCAEPARDRGQSLLFATRACVQCILPILRRCRDFCLSHLAVMRAPDVGLLLAGSTCLSTERSVCKKTCDASKSDGSGDSVSCTGFCRCEPECGGQCEAACCRLAFDLQPPRCNVLRYDCDYRQTVLEGSECNATSHLCTCGAGQCGYNVSHDGHMVCVEGFGAPCMPCPPGSYKPSLSLAACSPCRPGYSTRSPGATRLEQCEPLCQNGTSSETGFEVTPSNTCTLAPHGSRWLRD